MNENVNKLIEIRKEEEKLEKEYKFLSSTIEKFSGELGFKFERTYGENAIDEMREFEIKKRQTWEELEFIRSKIKALGGKTALEIENERRAEQELKEAQLKWELERPIRLERERQEKIRKKKERIVKIILISLIAILVVRMYLFFTALLDKSSVLGSKFQTLYLEFLLIPVSKGGNISSLIKLVLLFSFPAILIIVSLLLAQKLTDSFDIRRILKIILIITICGIIGGFISALYAMLFSSDHAGLCGLIVIILLVLGYIVEQSWTGVLAVFLIITLLHGIISGIDDLFPQVSFLVIIIFGFITGALIGIHTNRYKY